MAAMHAHGPYVLENVDIESSLVYSNNQPSSSIRAPTAPQVCWALEQHMDELAEDLGLDPVELRRRTLIDEGSITATGQVLENVAMKETLEAAIDLIGAVDDLPEDEAIGVACGWWPCFASNSGAYVKLNLDGTGTIVTGAQENGTGAVMAMPGFVAEELGMRPRTSRSSTRTQMPRPGTRARVARRRHSTTCGQCSRRRPRYATSFSRRPRSGSRRRPEDLELVDGLVRVKGSPDKAVTIAALAAEGTFHGKGSGDVPETPAAPAEGCVGRLGNESFHAPQLIAHAAHVKVDRDTGVVRVLRVAAAHDCGRILNRIGADGQVYGGVVMGIGQALTEGTQLDELGAPQEPPPARLQARARPADAPQIDVAWIETDTPNAGPRARRRRRAAVRADRGRDCERDREGDRRARQAAADDTRARLGGRPSDRLAARGAGFREGVPGGGSGGGSLGGGVAGGPPPRGRGRPQSDPALPGPMTTFTTAATLDDALAALAAGARPVAGGTDLVVGERQGKAATARGARGDPPPRGARRHRRGEWQPSGSAP